MTQEEFYNTLKGFTINDIPYLIDNNYIVSHDDTTVEIIYTVRKDFMLGNRLYSKGTMMKLTAT